MKQRSLFILCTVLAFSGLVAAQSKTVTNSDLAKFREKRLQAEKDLRENYAKLGFPSPEELERQIAKDAKEREELSARLTRERLERERLEAEQRWLNAQAAAQAAQTQIVIEEGGGYFSGFSNFRNRNRRGFFFGGNPIGWRAAGGQIIYEPGGRSSFTWSPSIQPRPRARWLR